MSCGIDKEGSAPLSSVLSSGELDPTFYNSGFLALNNAAGGNDDDFIYGIAKDYNDRIIAVGSSVNSLGNTDLVVWRFTSDGVLDTSFSGDGKMTHDNAAGGNSDDVGYGVAISGANEIYITGYSINGAGNRDMVVWKLTSSGALDTSFNTTGVFVHDGAAGGNLQDQGQKIALMSNGSVVVAGFSDQNLTNRDMAVWKLTSSGALDTSFNTTGYVTDDGAAGGNNEWANSLKIDASNNIYVAGQAETMATSFDMALWKFTTNGALDTSFNSTGIYTQGNIAGGNGIDVATDLVFDSEGSIYVSGYSLNSSGNNDMVVWKFNTSGTLNTDFNATGIVMFDVSSVFGGAINDIAHSLLIDSQGKIVVVGTGNDDLVLWRFNTNGELDTSFNVDGFFSHDSAAGGFGTDSGVSILQDPLNRLYIGGFSRNSSGNFDAVIWRLR